jgi:glycine/D-amino acid oxidase-like deaminating enzyme
MISGMASQNVPGWMTVWSEAPLPCAPQLEGTTHVDVAIIGAGFAGLSSARFLKEADSSLNIALVDRAHAGFGASGRNAGILSPFLPVPWLVGCSANERRLDDVRFAARYFARETQEFTRLIEREAIACDLRPTQIVTTGARGYYRHQIGLVAERCLLAGLPCHIATPEELEAAFPYPAHGGFVLEGHVLQPLALVQGLRRFVQRLGVRIYENTCVTQLRPARAGVEVLTNSGACLKADKVILATNAYTHQLGLGDWHRIPRPITTYLLATAPLDHAGMKRLRFESRTIVDIGGEYFYARLFQNRLLFGGFDRPSSTADESPDGDAPYHKRLRTEMTRRFPSLEDVPIDAQWSGPYHEIRTRVPIIRTLQHMPDVILNIGYGGVGVTLTQFSGRIAAGLVLGEKHQDPDSGRMRGIYAATRFPVKEGIKLGLRLAISLLRK